jgi:hypothetical protein
MKPGDQVIYRPAAGGMFRGEYLGRTSGGRLRIQIRFPHPWLVVTTDNRVLPVRQISGEVAVEGKPRAASGV